MTPDNGSLVKEIIYYKCPLKQPSEWGLVIEPTPNDAICVIRFKAERSEEVLRVIKSVLTTSQV